MNYLFDPNTQESFLQKFLKRDEIVSKKFAFYWGERLQINKYKNTTNFLHYSCSGIVWLVGLFAFAYFSSHHFIEVEINLLMILLFDIVVVSIVKAYVQRDPPSYCDTHPLNMDMNFFSFPSGYTTRATLILMYFTIFYPLPVILWIPVYLWFCAICLTRVLLRKHYLLDVFGGIMIASIEGIILSYFLVDKDTALDLFNWISDEKTVGSDAEVL
ncbi:polyisoprenoid diphosphate/phosphate phosphohydrolase PLPP6-like [Chironomus tepperi]|uniref:polyisoprenoid diphosphate/phosphate phosphohydrolase PLPP6-like n=1 Tax=Chironomus tepperi TaxID=113505 RepID=UPI00391F6F11